MSEQARRLISYLREKLVYVWRRLTLWPAGIPVVYSAIYILLVYRNNIFDVPPGEVVAPLVLTTMYVYGVYYLFKFLLKERVSAELATFVFTLISVHFGSIFNLFRVLAVGLLGYEPSDVSFGSMLIAAVFYACWIAGVLIKKRDKFGPSMLRFLQAGLFTFLGITMATIAYFYAFSWQIFGFDTPQNDIESSAVAEELPDIYYFVFDRYANNATMERYMNYSNGEFISELEDKGFLMNKVEHSSYPHTATALATNLNMEYADKLTNGLPPKYSELVYGRMINQSNVISELKESGYEINWSGSWWGPTRTNMIAERNYDEIFKAKILGAKFTVTNWQELLMGQHVLGRIMAADFPVKRDIFFYKQPQQADIVNFQFENVRRSVDLAGANPQFNYFHFLSPHPLYVFDENCTKPEYDQVSAPDDPKQIEKYVNQVKCLNSKISDAVDYILDNSPESPIIVIQPDEGPYFFALQDGQKLDTQEKARWKHGVISAVYLPEDSRPETYSMGSVNVLGDILNKYLGYDIELGSIKFHTYSKPDPYNFIDISDSINSSD